MTSVQVRAVRLCLALAVAGCAAAGQGTEVGPSDGFGSQTGGFPAAPSPTSADPLAGIAGGAAPLPTETATGSGTTELPTPGVGLPVEDPNPTADPSMPPSEPAPAGALVRGPEPTKQSASAPGPYATGNTTTGLADPAEYGTQTLWYPTDADPPFASIAIVPGFVSPESSIAPWGPFLASHGIVVLTIGTNSGADSPEIRRDALMAAIGTLKAEHARAGSPVQGKLDLTRMAVGGWSMGGGGTLLAATAHPELKAAMAICPWYLSSPFTANEVPTLLFAGTADVLAGGMSQPFYTAIPETTPKLLMEISGADHFYANNPIGASNQVGLYGLSWLKVFLEGDERYRQFLTVMPTGASDFRTNAQL